MAAVVVKQLGVVVPVTVTRAVSVWVETRLMVTKKARPCDEKIILGTNNIKIEILKTKSLKEMRIKHKLTALETIRFPLQN